jgi:hypothetical protein
LLPAHCVVPVAHTPQIPAPLQKPPAHAAAVPQVPLEPHVSTPFPEQRIAPGAQVPVHAPLTHA